jgi:hypothetical protein
MVLRLPFVILNIKPKIAKTTVPDTGYVELTLANNLRHPYFEQEWKCKVPFTDILRSPSFNRDIKDRIARYQQVPQKRDKQWIEGWVKLSNMLISVFQYNSKAYLTLLPPITIKK